ncbi:cadherin-87A [Drosophila bipectinata]|uniref:cadherin-87A n=1 Tax=Drosophila bipectinata TaxID=42026 RepID=UPI001C893534|nr:cadherin-87A isoform X1 [Drosophila bipectinata]XP_043068386.1 cadherin-87A isoform X1 [Drosophila bipectinata]
MKLSLGVLFIWLALGHANEETNLPPVFTQTLNNIVLYENVPVGTVVFTLEGYDPEGSPVTFGAIGSDHFSVDPISGNITLVEPLDREEKDSLKFLVSIRDRVDPEGESEKDNIVQVPITFIILDKNDNAPEFQNTPYEADVNEDAKVGTTIFDRILVKDRDIVGDSLDLKCLPQQQSPEACQKFRLQVTKQEATVLDAAVVLNDTLNYNQRMVYHFQIEATDGLHKTQTTFEARVKDVQDKPPVFQGSLSTVIDEDSPINTLVLTVHARDGDTGEPRKIVYDLLTNPSDYFLLDAHSGELRTAKPLDREALEDSTGIISLGIRARELVNGVPSDDPLTSATAKATVTIRDVNDSPPVFNRKEYAVSLLENTPPGTPLALDMSVSDADVGVNSKFALRLEDVSGVFDVEPKLVTGYSQVNIRVANGTLDYENPNQRKFIVLVVAEETDTNPRLSSTATITVSVLDANDNKPVFERDSYSASISEAALPGQYIATITAKDVDSGSYGDSGIRYSLSGTGAELFHVNEQTGVISLANCHGEGEGSRRERRDLAEGELEYGSAEGHLETRSVEEAPREISTEPTVQYTLITQAPEHPAAPEVPASVPVSSGDVAGAPAATANDDKAPQTCLDYETENTYFLSYKATDDNGSGSTSVVSLRISVTDANDSPPVCESPLYRASVDEGSVVFDSPLIVKARDADTMSSISYRIRGSEQVESIFDIDRESGQISIRPNASLDVTNLNSDQLIFVVEAHDGLFTASCGVNITVRDVNNHVPSFDQESYNAVIEENSEIGTTVERVHATDLDTGKNAELRYRIQQGSFDDFGIDERTGQVFVSRKLDFDRRNTYQLQVQASDLGTPSLTGTATLTINVQNSNDKDPYFVPATQHAEVRADAPPGQLVHTLIALDPDVASHNALEFAATDDITAIDKEGKELPHNDQFKEYFAIARNGKVLVNKQLDRNLFAVMRINVLVTDSTAPNVQQGRGLLIIQIIDVNKIPPRFNAPWSVEQPQIKLQIVEEQPIGTVLTTLQATDEDSSIGEFNISENDYFAINQTTGVIYTIAQLDYEAVKEVKFLATVSDTGVPALTATADVVVDIINLNDNEPKFTQSDYYFNITENSTRGTVAGKVEAHDGDVGVFGEITYTLIGENNKYFSIDAYTGNVMVANSSILDHEQIKELTLSVVAQDKAPATVQKSATATIHINILDVNDNAPVFTRDVYNSTVAENAAYQPPAALLQVQAIDQDEGLYGDVRYIITAGNEMALFKLDAQSGIVYPAQSLAGKHGVYELTISARDTQGSGTMESTATATITVLRVNRHKPEFLIPALSNATIEIPGDIVQPDYLLLTVKAADNDTEENGKISYHLQVNNRNEQQTGEFKIDEVTGELRARTQLNRKNRANYDIILVARDAGNPPFESLRLLSVSIVDANENRPEFPDASNPYKVSINENSGRDVKIGHIQAASRSKHNRDIFYYMLLGNEDGAFYVDKLTGDIYTNKSLDREQTDSYTLYILASIKADLHISEEERAAFSIKTLNRDSTVAKVAITVLDVNDNPPIFEKLVYYAGVNANAKMGAAIALVNATDADQGKNAKIEYMIVASNLYKFGASKATGSIVPSPFAISQDGRITANTIMAEYNQDHFELEIIAREIEQPQRSASTKVNIWVFDGTQLVRVILSRPPEEVYQEQEEIIAELRNATQHRIIVDEIRFHLDSIGRIRMDWCDLYFHAVDPKTQQIAPVDEILKDIDRNYDYLKDYYAGFAIENVVPAYIAIVQDEFDLAVAGLVALVIVLFVGVISFIVLCCCLKHWNLSVPVETRRKEALIKKQIIEDLNTTENPLWIEQKLKLYEEQELTMQVFSEPDHISNSEAPGQLDHRCLPVVDHVGQSVDNTYATIQPRSNQNRLTGGGAGSGSMRSGGASAGGVAGAGLLLARVDPHMNEFADYATLRNNRAPSLYEFTGSTFQAPIRDGDDAVAELI